MRRFEIARKFLKNQRLTPLLFHQTFWPKIVKVISPKNHLNHCKTNLYPVNFHIFTSIRKFEIGRKIVKNQRLIPLLFGEIFRPKIVKVISPKTHSNHSKTKLYPIKFDISNSILKFQIGGKIVKNQRLAPLVFGQIFRP